MAEDNKLPEQIINQSKDVLAKGYDDLVHPAAKSLGNTLSLVPRTIGVWLGKWEKWVINGEESISLTIEAVKEKASKIPEEKLTEPEPYVAVPAIQQLSYCYDSEELRELYANLLVSSMNTDTKGNVHPAFVEIIKQLTPDEAKLLKVLPRDSIAYQPLVDVELYLGSGNGSVVLLRNFSNISFGVCDCPENITSYLENLDRLKLITIRDDIYVMSGEAYFPLENHPYFLGYKNAKVSEPLKTRIKRKVFYITDFGLSFIKTCVDPK